MHPRHDRPCKHSDANTAILRSQFSGLSSDAEQSLNARCSELVLMRVYFTQQQQTKKKRKGAKFLDRACVRCGCAIQVADGAIKAAKDAARVDAHKDDKRGRQACDAEEKEEKEKAQQQIGIARAIETMIGKARQAKPF